jgi:1,4-dihydroxy-2-naphthoyl-CoA synthase
MRLRTILLLGAFAGAAFCADQAASDPGRKEEMRSCTQCHSLRIVDCQRLPRATWDKEITKMAGWGAPVQNREVLLNYLVAHFGSDKPIVPDGMTRDGRGKH